MEAKVLITDVYYIAGIGSVLVGPVQEGKLTKNMKLNVNTNSFQLKSIEMNRKMLAEANPGDNVGLSFTKSNKKLMASLKGQVLTFSDQNIVNNISKGPTPTNPEGFFNRFFKK